MFIYYVGTGTLWTGYIYTQNGFLIPNARIIDLISIVHSTLHVNMFCSILTVIPVAFLFGCDYITESKFDFFNSNTQTRVSSVSGIQIHSCFTIVYLCIIDETALYR